MLQETENVTIHRDYRIGLIILMKRFLDFKI